MFIVYLVLFVGGMYLFGAAFAQESPWQAVIFLGGLASVMLSLALVFRRIRD